MNPRARDLFERSYAAAYPPKNKHVSDWIYECGLPTHVVYRLMRRGFCINNEQGLPISLNVKAIREAVESGKIWRVPNIGVKSIQHICEWLTRNEIG
jgi:hypothetical protein